MKDQPDLSVKPERMNTRTLLSATWISHFLLWTFGDMLALLQRLNDPASNSLLLAVAVPLAILQAAMILFTLAGPATIASWANLIVVLPFVVFNVGYLTEAILGWQYLLGSSYLTANALIVGFAWRWRRV